MRKFKVILDFVGSQDGGTVTEFKAGEVVDISDHLAPHISNWAVPFDETESEDPPQAAVEAARPQLKLKRDAR